MNGIKSFLCMFIFFILITPAIAQGSLENTVKDKLLSDKIEFLPSGEMIRTQISERTAANDSAARSIAQYVIVFSDSLEKLEILEAQTIKASGQRLDVQPDAIHTELMPGASSFSEFNDLRRKTVIFPDVAAGDSVFLKIRWVRKPLFPGYFMHNITYHPARYLERVNATVQFPAGSLVRLENHGVTVNQHHEAGGEMLTWDYANTNPVKKDLGATSYSDRHDRVLFSTFPDWQTLSRTYAALALPKMEVTPEIKAKADEVTKGARSKRDEVERLYNWVTTQVRYVSVQLGIGGIEPHFSGQILAKHYGDCKDHAVLFGALLEARGIASEPVLINGSNGYVLPAIPTLFGFDHMITYVPSLGLYLDTTAGTVRFGQLPMEDYGKPVLHITTKGTTPLVTPLPALDNAVTTLITDAILAPDGSVTGTSIVEASGIFADLLRLSASQILSAGLESAATNVLTALGLRGEGAFEKPDDPHVLTADYRVSGGFSLEARPEIIEGESFTPPLGLALMSKPGDVLNGGLYERTGPDQATSCLPGRHISVVSLTLPPGRQLVSLPKDKMLAGGGAEYSVHWQQDGDKVTVRREYVSKIKGPLCEGAVRAEVAKLLVAIRADYRSSISLVPPPT